MSELLYGNKKYQYYFRLNLPQNWQLAANAWKWSTGYASDIKPFFGWYCIFTRPNSPIRPL